MQSKNMFSSAFTNTITDDNPGSYLCFERFDAALIETYDHFGPIVRAPLFSPGSNLLMHWDLVQALLYVQEIFKALIYVFFQPRLQQVSPRDEAESSFKALWHQSAPRLLPSTVEHHGC
ncbi:hypothetical protein XENOCAPTIV_023311 [Xenoophorus captivus]|uniref:Uncharacterized protein n=1 Tax=Xenoophorus captivus TaxID=1517983 RepID=A0ABV0QMQ6_9TELE